MRPPEDLNVHKSMGPKALHPRVLRDLADGTAEALIILESHGSHVKPPETGEKGIRLQGDLTAPCQYLKQIY